MGPLDQYAFIWLVDFEFTARPGGRPVPLCCCAREFRSGRLERAWLEGGAPPLPPYPTDASSLFVAYYASAELGCHLALDWPIPRRILDLFAEFRTRTNGLAVPCGSGLLGALAYFGLDALSAAEKESMRGLALRGGPYSDSERGALLDYCQSDVDALARLLPAVAAGIDLPRALLRGCYMAAVAHMEWNGVPVDAEALRRLRDHWDGIRGGLVAAVNARYGVYEPVHARVVDPATPLGAALLETAAAWRLDVYDLADAVDHLWRAERESLAARAAAVRAARRQTGLTERRVGGWEDSGRDHTSYRGLDVTARELAGERPELGIGQGYRPDAPDEDDHAARLWALLREPSPAPRSRRDPSLLREAAEWLASYGGQSSLRSMRFSAARWAGYLARRGIAWPMLAGGGLALDDDTFREMARRHPEEVGPVRELRHTLSQLRLNDLTVAPDGRNRCLLSAFRSRTGRNQPGSSAFIFGPSAWLRSLIRPGPSRAVAYCDWSAQELAIAAALSGDRVMQDAYRSGDPYLFLARKAGAVPPDATKETHGAERERFKVISLGVLYGLSADGLARKLGVPPCVGRDLLRMHRETFRRFWEWSDRVEAGAMLTNRMRTVFGWALHVGPDANPRSLRNWPMQAHGAEMMRLAACLATERGVEVCCPVHDAFLIEADQDRIEAETERMRGCMREASELVLPGFPLRTDAKMVRHPERYSDPRGRRMWELVGRLLDEAEAGGTPCTGATPTGDGTPHASATGSTDATRCTGATKPVAAVHPPPSLISSLSRCTPPEPAP